MQRPVERAGNLPIELVFEFGQSVEVKVGFVGEAGAPAMDIQQLEREAPLVFGIADGSVEDEADAEMGADVRGCDAGGEPEDCRGWKDVHVRDVCQP